MIHMNLYSIVPVIKSGMIQQEFIKEDRIKRDIHKKEEFKKVLTRIVGSRLEQPEKNYVSYNESAQEIYYRLANQINYRI